MNLKLAQYSKEGKFEGFLEIGVNNSEFSYAGNQIIFAGGTYHADYAFKDEKDPLNRFNGRFNGLTYGKGRFVLIEEDSDDFNSDGILKSDWMAAVYWGHRNYEDFIAVGNLHENSNLYNQKTTLCQLWEKIK